MKISLASVVAIASMGSAYGRLATFESIIKPSPTPPSPSPPTDQCECVTDDDCHPTCVISPYSGTGTCQTVPVTTPNPTKSPTPFPTPLNTPCPPCSVPKTIPTKCEVEILIAMMDVVVSGDLKRAAQWLRAAFHDAGTHDQTASTPVGGANGCLMNHPPMLLEAENAFLDIPMAALESIRNNWEGHPDTCIDISSADIIQFAGLFATVRQRGPVPGVLDAAKIDQLLNGFQWGRPDETACDEAWTHNLPGFSAGAGAPIVQRCLLSGGEIKTKMMDRNGFTEAEAVALIGAHTIGLIRNTFGVGLAGPWVTNGDDNAAHAIFGGLANGPVFDNAYHDFLINTVVENTAPNFAANIAPFTSIFPDWFRDAPNDLDHLDTDLAIAFPSTDLATHPHFDVHTQAFAADNIDFLTAFDAAYDKMSKLGVTVPLQDALECDPCELGGSPIIGPDMVLDAAAKLKVSDVVIKLVKDLGYVTANAEDVLDKKQEALSEEREKRTTEIDPRELRPVPETGCADCTVDEPVDVPADDLVMTRDSSVRIP